MGMSMRAYELAADELALMIKRNILKVHSAYKTRVVAEDKR